MARSNGLLLGLAAVVAFSLTLPMTRLAVPFLGAGFVSLARVAAAGIIALTILVIRRERFPQEFALRLLGTGLCAMLAYPILTSLALQHAPSLHAVILIGFMPSLTAIFAVLRGGERPPQAFWYACAAGALSVAIFAISKGAGHLSTGDLLLLAASVLCSFGYAEGAIIAKSLGGWRVVLWAQAVLLPVTIPVAALNLMHHGLPQAAPPAAWIAFADVVLVSSLLGFLLWYMGLSQGGVARISQLQLIQLPLSLFWSVLFLGERLDAMTVISASMIVLSAFATMLVRQRLPAKQSVLALSASS